MKLLHIINETCTNGLAYDTLSVITLFSVLCGIFVIVSKNPILSVLFLIGLFISIAGYLMMLGINFIGLSYLLVYVGAVSILFLFILMLINVRISELITNNNNSIPLAIMVGIFFNVTFYKLFPLVFFLNLYDYDLNIRSLHTNDNENINDNNNEDFVYTLNDLLNYSSEKLFFASSQVWDAAISEISHITSIGNVIYTVYPLLLILTSIILLLAMVGAIVITIK